ncbi:MAG: hypothetical protein BZY73_03490 [SAR202 cluster bacterium Casp-Chloro-G3]|nr:MAG: hypothetical protein BZY73_03490 [SAR202 cluster bacterium Casp-Chloro-G3]
MLDKLTIEDFEPYVNQKFLIQVEDLDAVAVELVEAVELASGGNQTPEARSPFSIVFRAPDGTDLPQKIYEITHDSLGVLQLFLVPIGPDKLGMCYQAIFT